MKPGDVIDGRLVIGVLQDCDGRDLPLFAAYDTIFACADCHLVFRTQGDYEMALGSVSKYYSIHEPIRGWASCTVCREKMEMSEGCSSDVEESTAMNSTETDGKDGSPSE